MSVGIILRWPFGSTLMMINNLLCNSLKHISNVTMLQFMLFSRLCTEQEDTVPEGVLSFRYALKSFKHDPQESL